LDAVGKLPESDIHCAALAAETLQEALNGYMVTAGKKDSPNHEKS